MDLFSPAALTSWQRRLNNSERFADAAGGWAGRLLLQEENGAGEIRRAWVTIDHGRCVEARTATLADEAAADFILAASPDTWNDLASARITPTAAALTGRLSLHKGNVLSLIPHARAAAELLAAAADGTL